MRLHRDFADPQFATDLLVQETRHDQRHDLTFALAEQSVAASQRLFLPVLHQQVLAPFQRQLDRGDQRVLAEGLGQDIDGACPHGLNRAQDVRVTGNADDRRFRTLVRKMLRHGQLVEHEATWHAAFRLRKQGFGRGNLPNPPAHVVERGGHAPAGRGVLCDDEDDARRDGPDTACHGRRAARTGRRIGRGSHDGFSWVAQHRLPAVPNPP